METTEFNRSVSILNDFNTDEVAQCKPSTDEMIYANSHMVNNEVEFVSSNNFVPLGRKPALPPKPPNRPKLNLTRPKEFAQTAFIFKTNGKSSPKEKDPAEMSVKERSALFENSFDANTKKIAPKTPVRMSIPNRSSNIIQHHVHTSTQTAVHQKPAHCGNPYLCKVHNSIWFH